MPKYFAIKAHRYYGVYKYRIIINILINVTNTMQPLWFTLIVLYDPKMAKRQAL